MKHHRVRMAEIQRSFLDRVGMHRVEAFIAVALASACLASRADANTGTIYVRAFGHNFPQDIVLEESHTSSNQYESAYQPYPVGFPGAGQAFAERQFAVGTIDHSFVTASVGDRGWPEGATAYAALSQDFPANPTTSNVIQIYTISIETHIYGYVGEYATQFPFGSPFGDNPSMNVYASVEGNTGGFYVGSPVSYRADGYGNVDDTRTYVRKVVLYPGDYAALNLSASGEHYPSSAGYAASLVGHVSAYVGGPENIPFHSYNPPGGGGAGAIPWTQGPWTSPSGAYPPNASCAVAFLSAASSPTVVSMDQNITLGRLAINSPVGGYTVTGPGTLTLACSSDSVGIDSLAGTHTVSAAVSVQNNVNFSAAAVGDSLSLTGAVSYGSGVGVSKSGTGLVTLPVFAAESLMVAGGILQIAAGGSPGNLKVKHLEIALTSGPPSNPPAPVSGAQLNLQNNRAFIDYDTGDGSPLLDIATYIHSGYNAGAWNGVGIVGTMPTSRYRLGYAEISAIGSPSTFLSETVDSTTVVIRRTYGGDSNLDGAVNFADLAALGQNYNLTGKTWVNGDFNYDGTVDFADLTILSQNYGSTPLTSAQRGVLATMGGQEFVSDFLLAQSLVPEPTSLLVIGGVASAAVRRRRH